MKDDTNLHMIKWTNWHNQLIGHLALTITILMVLEVRLLIGPTTIKKRFNHCVCSHQVYKDQDSARHSFSPFMDDKLDPMGFYITS